VNYLKKSRRYKTTSLDAVGKSLSTGEGSSYDELHRRQMQQMLRECLDELDPKYRGPLLLYYFEDKSYREISDILRVPTGTVGTLISRGKAYLKVICQRRMAGKDA
jgi:RNA polymerase sigma-70 factor (ECF subfamily)